MFLSSIIKSVAQTFRIGLKCYMVNSKYGTWGWDEDGMVEVFY